MAGVIGLYALNIGSPLSYVVALLLPALDALLPWLPSETVVIALGAVTAGSADPRIGLLVALAAVGAFLGDNAAYLVGRRFGPVVDRRLFAGERGAHRRAWAQRSLDRFGMRIIIACRFVPGGRTAVTLTCGLVGYPRRRFVPATAVAAIVWASYAFFLGRLGGKVFEDRPWAGLLLALGLGLALSLLIEAGRRIWRWRATARDRARRPPDPAPRRAISIGRPQLPHMAFTTSGNNGPTGRERKARGPMAATVLLVEDERKLRELIRTYLERAGLTVVSTDSGAEAISLAASAEPDLVILDLGLPDVPGETVAAEVRAAGRVPILMLTAKAAEEDRIAGLELGADDYVTKPFSPRELVLRIQAILRRGGPTSGQAASSYGSGTLVIDEPRREVKVRNTLIELTPTEWGILLALATVPGRVYSRYELINRVRGYEFEGYERTVDSHVKNLRRKIERGAGSPAIVQTVMGGGYRLGLARDA
jgi:DNA-binding response OmpR family regulator/membrane protein DedA with SNARE-associated domain